ncbi:hypothetical protein SR39_30555 [Methylobacterium radiotolerans]|nr:hypothetical protein SR39_30555 [Methylobacterium radiotolerans]
MRASRKAGSILGVAPPAAPRSARRDSPSPSSPPACGIHPPRRCESSVIEPDRPRSGEAREWRH